jgi:hypothetical protein
MSTCYDDRFVIIGLTNTAFVLTCVILATHEDGYYFGLGENLGPLPLSSGEYLCIKSKYHLKYVRDRLSSIIAQGLTCFAQNILLARFYKDF